MVTRGKGKRKLLSLHRLSEMKAWYRRNKQWDNADWELFGEKGKTSYSACHLAHFLPWSLKVCWKRFKSSCSGECELGSCLISESGKWLTVVPQLQPWPAPGWAASPTARWLQRVLAKRSRAPLSFCLWVCREREIIFFHSASLWITSEVRSACDVTRIWGRDRAFWPVTHPSARRPQQSESIGKCDFLHLLSGTGVWITEI